MAIALVREVMFTHPALTNLLTCKTSTLYKEPRSLIPACLPNGYIQFSFVGTLLLLAMTDYGGWIESSIAGLSRCC
jgi:hypothetical protein